MLNKHRPDEKMRGGVFDFFRRTEYTKSTMFSEKKAKKPILFSGVQPSGTLHIGNFLGAIKNWVELQDKYECLFCIVDYHALTVPQDPKILKEKIKETVRLYLACGIDHRKSIIFQQSDVLEHTNLAWLLTTLTNMGELSRMTQFKDKTQGQESGTIGVGIFEYPVLMAADILLYGTNVVPVGEDQQQHVELARDLAKRFNHRFGETFVVPEGIIKKDGARIMGLDNPEKKMSKSAVSEYNYIALDDSPEDIRRKISRAATDSSRDIVFDPKRPGIYNLLTIYKIFSGLTEKAIEKKFKGVGYADFKQDLAETIIKGLKPIQDNLRKLEKQDKHIERILEEGAEKARELAKEKMKVVKEKMGLK